MTTPHDRRAALLTVLGLVVLATIGLAVGWAGWPGQPSGCLAAGDCSCEALSGGVVEQPVNAASSAVLIAAGVVLVARAARVGDRSRFRLAIAYGVSVAVMGAASLTFHASVTEWGGWLDLVAVHAFVSLVLLIDVAALAERSAGWVLRWWAGATIAAATLLWPLDNGLVKYPLGALVLAVLIVEVGPAGSLVRERQLLVPVASFGVAGLALQWLGRGGGWLCDPGSLVQPHALWHVAATAAVVVLSRYLFAGPTDRPRAMSDRQHNRGA